MLLFQVLHGDLVQIAQPFGLHILYFAFGVVLSGKGGAVQDAQHVCCDKPVGVHAFEPAPAAFVIL